MKVYALTFSLSIYLWRRSVSCSHCLLLIKQANENKHLKHWIRGPSLPVETNKKIKSLMFNYFHEGENTVCVSQDSTELFKTDQAFKIRSLDESRFEKSDSNFLTSTLLLLFPVFPPNYVHNDSNTFVQDISKHTNCYHFSSDLLSGRKCIVFVSDLSRLLKRLFCSQYPLLTSNFPIFHAYNGGHKT